MRGYEAQESWIPVEYVMKLHLAIQQKFYALLCSKNDKAGQYIQSDELGGNDKDEAQESWIPGITHLAINSGYSAVNYYIWNIKWKGTGHLKS